MGGKGRNFQLRHTFISKGRAIGSLMECFTFIENGSEFTGKRQLHLFIPASGLCFIFYLVNQTRH